MAIPTSITLSSEPFYRGSVQDLYEVEGEEALMVAETTSGGSVFDVGTIFQIKGSDTCRALFRHWFYSKIAEPSFWRGIKSELPESNFKEQLLAEGLASHHCGLLEGKSQSSLITAPLPTQGEVLSNKTCLQRFPVITPSATTENSSGYDYSALDGLSRYVIPLEIIMRFGLLESSSIYRRYQSLPPAEQKKYAQEKGLDEPLVAGQMIDQPLVDFTSKYEPMDRPLSVEEAAEISRLKPAKFAELQELAKLAGYALQSVFEGMGLQLWDLKWEFARDGETFYLVDTIDPDSVRVTYSMTSGTEQLGVHMNKQAMRDYYEIMHADWCEAVKEAKLEGSGTEEGFLGLLKERVADGSAPATPTVDPAFLDIQSMKFLAIQDYLLSDAEEAGILQKEFKRIASLELGFYQEQGHVDAYISKTKLS